ncbi:MAG: DoxX family protein [Bacteroidetes bacterium]|jgi:uncharacterized membrane protein|nr:DoxX family protein [Bacteroidota bacterium]
MTNTTSTSASARSAKARDAVRIGFALFFVAAGLNHFITPEWYLANQMPPWVPFPLAMLYLTGIAEIAGGIGLLIRPVRQWAMWGLLLLLLGIFPANVHMFLEAIVQNGWSSTTVGLLLRLPLQAVFMYAVWWSARRRAD